MKDLIVAIAIVCITTIALIAISEGLDGSTLYTAIIAISGLAGYTIGKGQSIKPN